METNDKSQRAYIIHPDSPEDRLDLRAAEDKLEEACGLAEAISLEVVAKNIVPLRQVKPGTFLGSGKVEEIKEKVRAQDIDLVIMNCSLSPVQQRNLEKSLECKVIDRTALILEIFGERARTKEGVMQVELAALEYQKSRLVRSWTHLERQRGGGGFMGGPGERQIESDRRAINDRISSIKKQLGKVTKTRGLHRKSRKKIPYPVVALVGYTNAGKSTLFNRLTGAKVMAEDMLFATLDPTMRLLRLPSGRKVMLSDTVGFISDLPTELIAAFRATLEEVVEADIILHIRDVSSPDNQAQKQDVLAILESLGMSSSAPLDNKVIEVLNKMDRLQEPHMEGALAISALTGEGCDRLLKTIDDTLAASQAELDVTLPAGEGRLIAWIYDHGEEVKANTKGDQIHVRARLSPKNLAKWKKMKPVGQ